MKITLARDAICGELSIPKGDYFAALGETGFILLTGAGKTHKLKATKRRAASKTKTIQVAWYCAGGVTWSLVVTTPKHGEWISMLDLKKKDAD